MIIFNDSKIAKTTGNSRSYDIRKATNEYLLLFPICEICGTPLKVSVHHVKSIKRFPELSVDKTNMISLCDDRSNPSSCHLRHGHLGDWNKNNTNINNLRNRMNSSRSEVG